MGVRLAALASCDSSGCHRDLRLADDPAEERFMVAGDDHLDEAGETLELAGGCIGGILDRQRGAVRVVRRNASVEVSSRERKEAILLCVIAGSFPGLRLGKRLGEVGIITDEPCSRKGA